MTADTRVIEDALKKYIDNGGNEFVIPVKISIFNADTDELLVEKEFEVGVFMAEFMTARETQKAMEEAVKKLGNPEYYELVVKSHVYGVCNHAYKFRIAEIDDSQYGV